ncbi:MAG: radical SAM protein [Ruminococcaceae bacterium]|nr:radical SAM protein [Oscillospiraceae bacterium]
MAKRTVKEQLQAFGLSKLLGMIRTEPDKNLMKLLEWVDRLDMGDTLLSQRTVIRNILEDESNPWNQFIKEMWSSVDDDVRVTFFENFIVYAGVIGNARLVKSREEHGCNVPWAILMDPTSACNLGCTGCWAAEYGDQMSMSFEELDSIIEQGKELGTYMYIYSGGEPLVRKKDIIRLCEKHSECMFLAFTNGTLIDEAFADEMLRVKNFAPAISIEGFEEATDARRGAGTYQKVIRAMEILRERKLIYGASLCYTSENTDVIASDAFMDHLIELGNKFAWYFTYMPVGVGSPTELIATAPQREQMYTKIREWRETKPIFTMDFWNDGEYVQGCIAGGRIYMHINAGGDYEPCAFIHYSDSNIRENTLLQALQSPLFMAYMEGQPFNENHLRPCPLLDNQGALADLVHKSGAHSTDLTAPENVDDLCAKCKQAADNWQIAADRLWKDNEAKRWKKMNQGAQPVREKQKTSVGR